jgi:glycosyltransferase involved in cell wall biosynthesis
MAAGLVPVVSDIEGNREWVTHRREGYLVPGDDADATACAIAEIAAERPDRDPLVDPSAIADRARAKVAALGRFEDTVRETEARLTALAAAAPRRASGPERERGGVMRPG